MRILFADPFDDGRLASLADAGHECRVEDLEAADLPARISSFDALVVRGTRVTADTVAAADRLGLIVRAGAGIDTIDRAAASSAGVYVCNVPGRNAIAVAELTVGLLLAVDRQIADAAADLRLGRWDKARYATADGVYGKRLAIIGLGDIGLAVAERAKALGMTISALRKDQRSSAVQGQIRSIGIRLLDSLEELLRSADVVSLHVPRSPDTIGLVDDAFLGLLPDGAIVLNTSRGEVVDEAALVAALDRRGMRAGLDVFRDEPSLAKAEWTSALAAHPRVVGTHHVGASTRQAQESVADGVVEVLRSYESGEPINCVNLMRRRGHTAPLVVRHLDRVGVLAAVLNVLRQHGLNVQQMSNQVFEGGEAAVATIEVDGAIDASVLAALDRIDEVLATAGGS